MLPALRSLRTPTPLLASVLFLGTLALGAPAHAQSPASSPPGPRVLVLRVGGEEALASALGPSLQEAAHAYARALSLTPLPTDGTCDDLDCAAGFLGTGAADAAAFIEVFGQSGVCQGVQATVLVPDGTRFSGTAEVGLAGVEEAMRVALAQAVARFRGEALPTLAVNGGPAGATIRLDDVTWGHVPHGEPVAPGPHVLEVRARGHRTVRREITLGGEDLTLEITLTPGEDGGAEGGRGGDATLLWVGGIAGVALGVAALAVGIAGFAMGDACVDAACSTYDRPDATASGVWLGTGGALTIAGAVMLGMAASSGPSGERAGLTLRARF